MLELINIKKDYILKDQEPVHALKGISLNFRKNEFVAILGPSGCGKTTLLNITGGLDRYSSGDLIIRNKSTKKYSDYDWDTYRNHSIGFVFQSYNLISHQNILKNVELALTISGISKIERRRRAIEVLELVGLKGLEKKKPNQMSGGQMQRVAIARALINNPEILLADEPTGALDSETSIQIMDILKEVAKSRLVIMVTHNPELANKYANRIVNMKDGLVLSDTNPFDGKEIIEDEEVNKGKKKNSSMSFATATGLSFSNLISKIKRTILVTIAGSIGIIGVSAVLAMSQGLSDYIVSMQDDMLSSYPITIAEESVDYTSLISGLNASTAKQAFVFNPDNPKVGMDSMVTYLMTAYSDFTSVKTNTINEDLLDFIDSIPNDALASVYKNYGIDTTNNIFTTWKKDYSLSPGEKQEDVISLNGLTQRYIAELKTVKGFSNYASYVDLFTGFMKGIPGNEEYILSQYDLLGNSSFPKSKNEMLLVVDKNNTLTDLLLAQLGYYNHDEFINIAKQAIEKNGLPDDLSKEEREAKIKEIEAKYPYRSEFNYDELLNKEFYYYPQSELYSYQEVAESEITTSIFLIDLTGQRIFSMQYNPDNDTITGSLITMSGKVNFESVSFIRKDSKPEISSDLPSDYVTGKWICFDSDENIKYTIDFSSIKMGYASIFDKDSTEPSVAMGSVQDSADPVEGYAYDSCINEEDFITYPENHGGFKMKISGIVRLKNEKSFGCLSRGIYYSNLFMKYYMNDALAEDNQIINDPINGFKSYIGSVEEASAPYKAYVTFDYLDYTDENNPVLFKNGYANCLNGDLSSSFSDLFSSITGVNYYETDKVHFRSLTGEKITEVKQEDEIISYNFSQIPEKIELYPNNFQDKDIVTNHLDKWNEDGVITLSSGKQLSKADRNELTYTDTVKLIVAVINTLITSVTIALVSFTSLSLVVSCFMIAVITYISVMERVKEIGIIRSLGGRKKDVSRLFIAETFMTGLFSGIFGIALTYIFELILNISIYTNFAIKGIANLTIPTALIMIGVSILLSVLSGLIPSMKASKSDPVVALRSE